MINPRTLLIGIVLFVAACGGEYPQDTGEEAATTGPGGLVLVASNYPLYFFASRIIGDVEGAPEIVLPDIDGDPAFWTPSPGQVQLLQSADLILLNGAGAESWLNLITLDRRRFVDTSSTVVDKLIPLDDSVQHQHGPEGEHSHQGTAFTTWLDPQIAIAQAGVLANSLIDLAPTAETQFRDNLANLEQELTELDARLADAFARLDGRPVLFSHPVYQYLERRYGINGESVHWEPDVAPLTSDWIALQQVLVSHPATIMVWEDEPLEETITGLAKAGILSVPFQTVANMPDEGDFLSVMRDNVEQLHRAIP
jgi:zinc transport system substrate-binding protein